MTERSPVALVLPDGMAVEQVAQLLESRLAQASGQRLGVAEGEAGESESWHYDTFDARVRAAGKTVVWRPGRLSLLPRDGIGEPPGEHTGEDVGGLTPPARLTPVEFPPGRLRDALIDLADVRALLPVAHVHRRALAIAVLDRAHATVSRVVLEQPVAIEPGSGRTVRMRVRAWLIGARGYDHEREAVRAALEEGLGAVAAGEPLVDEAIRAVGGDPRGIRSKIEVALSTDQRSDVAAVAVLRALLDLIAANLPGAIDDVDAEFLHDLRVAVRRTRAVQRELKAVFSPADALAHWRAELRWLQQVTGPARDMDVYVLDFNGFRELLPEAVRPDLEPLRRVLVERRLAARRQMVSELRSPRGAAVLAGWGLFLDGVADAPLEDRPLAMRPIAEVAGDRIVRVYRRMLKWGGAITPSSPPADYHELRKQGKELRYLLELFGAPLFDPAIVSPMVRALRGLQDTLGRHQDREVQVATLRRLAGEVASLPDGPNAVLAMGALVERLHSEEVAARAEFSERFARFSSKRTRKPALREFGRPR